MFHCIYFTKERLLDYTKGKPQKTFVTFVVYQVVKNFMYFSNS